MSRLRFQTERGCGSDRRSRIERSATSYRKKHYGFVRLHSSRVEQRESERPRFIASLELALKLSLWEEMKRMAARLNLNSKMKEETHSSLERTLAYQKKCAKLSRKL